MYQKTKLFTAIMLIVVLFGCMPPTQGNLEAGFTIWGYVGNTATEPASNVMVLLVDGNSDKPIASKNSNFLGKYKFSGLRPGYYKIRISDKEIEAVITTENQRVDIDLSSETGTMNYASAAIKDIVGNGKPGGDPELVKRFSGQWYSYSGALSGGGSENQMGLCSNGNYYESYEAGYYGSDASSAWGSASESGNSGSWSIEGNVQRGTITIKYRNGSTSSIQYQQSNDDPQCYYFDNRLHCYNGVCK